MQVALIILEVIAIAADFVTIYLFIESRLEICFHDSFHDPVDL